MRCDICKRKVDTLYGHTSDCPQCGARYCEACIVLAESAGDVSTDCEYVGDPPTLHGTIIWRNCHECGVIRV